MKICDSVHLFAACIADTTLVWRPSAAARGLHCGFAAGLFVFDFSCGCDCVDALLQLGISAQELLEVVIPEHQQLAVTDCGYVSLAASARYQGHFTEEIPGNELFPGAYHRHFDGSR